MKLQILLLLSIISSNGIAFADSKKHSGHERKPDCCAPRIITKAKTIKKSGAYCLGKDIKGSVIIAADNVCLDLNCHKVSGCFGTPAISSTGFKNVSIINGTVENERSIGLQFTDCDDLTLADLTICPVNQALFLENCRNGSISRINANNNLSTTGNVIELCECDSFTLTDIEVNDCIKERTESNQFDLAMLLINGSTNVHATRCKTNRIESKDLFVFGPIAVAFSDNVRLDKCESNGCFSEIPGSGDPVITIVYSSNNVFLNDHCSNDTSISEGPNARAYGFSFSDNLSLVGCQANRTTLDAALLNTSDSGAVGVFFLLCDNVILRACQANGMRINSGSASSRLRGAQGIVIIGGSGFVIEDCQANDNVNFSPEDGQVSVGMFFATTNLTIRNCTTTGNGRSFGAPLAFGMLVSSRIFPSGTISFIDCESNNNAAAKLAAGIATGSRLDTDNVNITVEGCITDRNRAEVGYGVAFERTFDSKVVSSNATGNTSSGFFLGPVLQPFFEDVQVVSNNIKIEDNCAQANQIGFLFDVNSVATGILVEGNQALGNTSRGFEQLGTFNGTWISNIARGNTLDYNVSSGLQEFILRLDGTYDKVSGDGRLVSFTNLSAEV